MASKPKSSGPAKLAGPGQVTKSQGQGKLNGARKGTQLGESTKKEITKGVALGSYFLSGCLA